MEDHSGFLFPSNQNILVARLVVAVNGPRDFLEELG